MAKTKCPDGDHPNEKGAELWAQSISQQIIPFIKAG
jgi:lysophospholipase L1-like esterase